MKIIILTPVPFWHPGTSELINGLRENQVEVTALDIWSFKFYDVQNRIIDLMPRIFTGAFSKIYRRVFRKKVIKKYLKGNDIVDIQWCGHYYSNYMDLIGNQNLLIFATLFGSDIYRNNIYEKKIQIQIFEKADKVVMSENMKADFEKYFPGFSSKIEYAQYGSKRIDVIQKLNTPENKKSFLKKYNIPENKIVTTIGYNAKPEQQHLIFLDCLNNLSKDQKGKIFLILPLTYGVVEGYIAQLKLTLEDLNIDYLCIEKSAEQKEFWLNDEELAELRIISDVTVNLQTTDAMSSSIKEAMLTGDVLIVGDWLPYKIFEDIGLYLIRSNKEDLLKHYIDVITDITLYKGKCINNGEIIISNFSWQVLLPKFLDVYREAYTNNHGRNR